MIVIVIRGGPEGLGPVRHLDADVVPDRMTVPFYGHHQHFERTDEMAEAEGRQVPVFRWTYSTKIAE
ncbi:DUF5988 family protein [Streptomyces melanogenes]|uniref:DUF5988 family protein n=1 Tax=Streptomyces melanogenes TaxID=67326 RepID=UPI00379FCAC1